MFGNDNGMKVTCSTAEVLEVVRQNKEKHAAIVKEARDGYMAKALEQVKSRLEALEKGKLVSLQFHLAMPVDRTAQYDTVIKMLEMHLSPSIELGMTEVSRYIEDKWEWRFEFLSSNAGYSETARKEAQLLGNDLLNGAG